MKSLILLSVFMFSGSVFAKAVCEYRFNSRLAVTVTWNYLGSLKKGKIMWDDDNVCRGGSCTEVYPGTFNVRFKDLTPEGNVGAIQFKVKTISSKDDLGHRYHSSGKFGDFIRNARFESYVLPDANLHFTWKGRERDMKCEEN